MNRHFKRARIVTAVLVFILSTHAFGLTGSGTEKDPGLVEYRKSEVLTTKQKKVDASKAIRDLDHNNSYSFEEGIRITAKWLRSTISFEKSNYEIDPSTILKIS